MGVDLLALFDLKTKGARPPDGVRKIRVNGRFDSLISKVMHCVQADPRVIVHDDKIAR